MEIRGFIHCLAVENWREILSEQLRLIESSGLGACSKAITIVILDPYNRDPIVIRRPTMQLELIWIRQDSADGFYWNLAEGLTLECIHSKLSERETSDPCLVWYLHAKGVTKYRSEEYPNVANWRRLCESVVVSDHETCVKALTLENYDACGPLLNVEISWPHFSGNFWWARSDYLERLPKPSLFVDTFVKSARLPSRWAAEAWVLSGNGKAKDLLHVPEALASPWLYSFDTTKILEERNLTPEPKRRLRSPKALRKARAALSPTIDFFRRWIRIPDAGGPL